MNTPEIASKINIWRQKAVQGTLTMEETREAIQLLRGGRVAAAKASDSAKRKTAIKAIPTADDLLSEIGGAE